MYNIMTPGPTKVRENVRMARSLETTNPDLDESFYEDYRAVCKQISRLMHTKNETYLLSGEGILGLEAACASLTEQRDRVLIIDNGIFGKGFKEFVELYGGKPVVYTCDYHTPVNEKELETYLEKDHDFVYATLVHCDTPSGVLNDLSALCPLLKKYGILTVVDSVAGMFGEVVNVDQSQIDILCGGSQKVLSAPAGMTFVTVSDDAKKRMRYRTQPIASFYCNLQNFEGYYEKKWFPYTMPISDIYGVKVALENVEQDKNIIKRHQKIARATREAIKEAGLQLYLKDGYASTVTVFYVPDGMLDTEIIEYMKKNYNILIAGCFDALAGKVLRIGHMGENANQKDVADTLYALSKTLNALGYRLPCDMKESFKKHLNES